MLYKCLKIFFRLILALMILINYGEMDNLKNVNLSDVNER